MTYWAELKDVFRQVPRNLWDKGLFKHIGEGFLATLYLLIRLAVLVIFPVSFPLLAYLSILDKRRTEQLHAAAMVRLRENLHQMGERVRNG